MVCISIIICIFGFVAIWIIMENFQFNTLNINKLPPPIHCKNEVKKDFLNGVFHKNKSSKLHYAVTIKSYHDYISKVKHSKPQALT